MPWPLTTPDHDAADSRDEAEDIWLPVLAARQNLVNPDPLAQRADQPPSRTYEEPLANDAGAEHR